MHKKGSSQGRGTCEKKERKPEGKKPIAERVKGWEGRT